MATTAAMQRSCTMGGKTFKTNVNLSGPTSIVKEVSVPKAVAATLTTHTDATDGVLTLAVSGSLGTGQIIDLYFGNGVQRRVTVGTVAGLSAPVTGGTGDPLPVAGTAVICGIVQNAPFSIVGNNLIALGLDTDFRGIIDALTSVPASGFATGTFATGAAILDTNISFDWFNDNGTPNPLAGVTIVAVNFSHSDVNSAHNMRIGALLNS